MVLVRTIVVPSTGSRTAVVSGCAVAPLAAAAAVLGATTTQDIPGPAFFAGAVMYSALAVAIASAGSRIIYGLRRSAALGVELGQYRLDRRIGAGPLGEVFLARHALLPRATAVKLIRPEGVSADIFARCEHAVQQMSQLGHHNTVAVFDYGRSPEGVFYVAMEYLDGIDIAALVERNGPQPAERAIAIALQLCDALHEAHRRGFVHGNIKPSNIILCERGGMHDVAKLTDYGFGEPATVEDDVRAVIRATTFVAPELEPVLAGVQATSVKELATRLRTHDTGRWTHAHAREWWMQLKRQSSPSLEVPVTISVDLRNLLAGESHVTRAD